MTIYQFLILKSIFDQYLYLLNYARKFKVETEATNKWIEKNSGKISAEETNFDPVSVGCSRAVLRKIHWPTIFL